MLAHVVERSEWSVRLEKLYINAVILTDVRNVRSGTVCAVHRLMVRPVLFPSGIRVVRRLVWVSDSHELLMCCVTNLAEINSCTSSTPLGTVIYYRVKLVSDAVLLPGNVEPTRGTFIFLCGISLFLISPLLFFARLTIDSFQPHLSL